MLSNKNNTYQQQHNENYNKLIDLCHKHCSGSHPLTTSQQSLLRQYFSDANNALNIINIAQNDHKVMVCYHAVIKEKLRSGEYFGVRNLLGDESKDKERNTIFCAMIGKLINIPNHENISHKNMYLSVLGTILANYLTFNNNMNFQKQPQNQQPDILTICLKTIISSTNRHPLTIIYQLIKCIQYILQQLHILQCHYITPYKLYIIMDKFIKIDGCIILDYINNAILKKLNNYLKCQLPEQVMKMFVGIKSIIDGVYSVMEMFYKLLGFNGNRQQQQMLLQQQQQQHKSANNSEHRSSSGQSSQTTTIFGNKQTDIRLQILHKSIKQIPKYQYLFIQQLQQITQLLTRIIQIINNNNSNNTNDDKQTIVCQLVNCIQFLICNNASSNNVKNSGKNNGNKFVYQDYSNSKKKQEMDCHVYNGYQEKIGMIVWERLLFPHIISTVNYYSNNTSNNTYQVLLNPNNNSNIQSSLLKILTKLTEYLSNKWYNQHKQQQQHYNTSNNNPSQTALAPQQLLIFSFSQLTLKQYQPNYNNLNQCIIILIFKFLYQLKYDRSLTLHHYQNHNINNINNINNLSNKYYSINSNNKLQQITQIGNSYNKLVNKLFNNLVLKRLVYSQQQQYKMNYNYNKINPNKYTLQNQQSNNDIINYQQYITGILTDYFEQLLIYGPKYMEEDCYGGGYSGSQMYKYVEKMYYNKENNGDGCQQLMQQFILFNDSQSEQEQQTMVINGDQQQFINYSDPLESHHQYQHQQQQQLSTSSTKKYSPLNHQLFKDYQLLSNLISSISYQYSKQLPQLLKLEQYQFNKYIVTKTLPLLVCLHAIINSRLYQSELKSLLQLELYQLVQCFQINLFEIQRENKGTYRVMQTNLCKIYVVHMFLQHIMPEKYIIQGETASLTAMYAEKKHGKNLVDYVLDGLDSVSFVLQYHSRLNKSVGNNLSEIKQFSNNQFDQELSTFQQIASYGLKIFSGVAMKLSSRVGYLQSVCPASNLLQNQEQIQTCSDLLNFIYQQFTQFQFETPQSNKKLYQLAGLITDMFHFTSVYETYYKLRSQCLLQQVDEEKLMLYFSGGAGLLKNVSTQQKTRIIVELMIPDLQTMINTGMLKDMSEQLQQQFIYFAKQITNQRIFKTNDNLNLKIQQIFHPILSDCLPSALQIPELKGVTQLVYMNFTKLSTFSPLIKLPYRPDYCKQLLNIYFMNISRMELQGVLQMSRYVHLKIDWMIEFFNYHIQTSTDFNILKPYLDIYSNTQYLAKNYVFERKDKIIQLAGVIHYYFSEDQCTVGEISKNLLEKRKEQLDCYHRQFDKVSKIIGKIK